jgi:hypothetical protein
MHEALLAVQATRTGIGIGGALASGFVLATASALIASAVFSYMTSKTSRGEWFVRRGFDGSIDMERTSKWRLTMGATLLSLAGIVGVIGYVKISLETLIAAQIVYLASAGFGVVILAVAGGALIVSDQLRADESRINELEHALATLGDRLAPSVAEPPRLLGRD